MARGPGGGGGAGGAGAAGSVAYSEHRAKTPPPDLPSLLLDSRIVYLGMPLVPAVTELIVAELLYMQYTDGRKPVYLYINSTGCTRADGETVGFETEATAIYDTMNYIANPVYTVGSAFAAPLSRAALPSVLNVFARLTRASSVGVAIGQACMLLSAGEPGHRFMMPHATAMLHQPRIPGTGQRQATELYIKWREVLAQKRATLDILALTTGHSVDKLDADSQRPLYLQPGDALKYKLIDKILPDTVKGVKGGQAVSISDTVMNAEQWDKGAGLVAVSR